MICPKCHTPNNYFHQYCYRCGTRLPQPDGPAGPQSDAPDTQVIFNARDDRHKRETHPALRGVIILCGVLILAAAVWRLPRWGQSGNAANSAPAPGASVSRVPSAEPAPTPVPLVLEVADPADGWMECAADGQCQIRIITNAAQILVNDEPVETRPDAGGEWTVPVTPASCGNNRIVITAMGGDGQSVRSEVIVYRRYPDVPLTLADGQPLSTQNGTLTLAGSVLPGCALAVSGSLACGAPWVDARGNFSLELAFPVIPGEYDFALELSAPGYENTRYAWTLTRSMDEDAYVAAAVACDYDALLNDPGLYEGAVMYMKGVVANIPDPSSPRTFTFLVGGREERTVLVEYTGQTSMEPGDRRTLYGEYAGMEQGMPRILVRLGYRR